MLTDATNRLILTARDNKVSDADLNKDTQSFFEAIRGASRDDANSALGALSQHFNLENPSRGAFLALVCGSLVERGLDPMAIAGPLTERLANLLKASVKLADCCEKENSKTESEDEDPQEVFEKTRIRIAPEMKQENESWEALKKFWPPSIAVFSVSAEARSSAEHLRDLAIRISDYHDAGHWLQMMFAVLDNEPFLAIEPETMLGVLGRISGIVDNCQLNVLLMDGFPKSGLFARRRVPQSVVDVALGKGPQQTNQTVTSPWNLYTWEAIMTGMELPDPNDHGSCAHWVWNEGTPADIPVLMVDGLS